MGKRIKIKIELFPLVNSPAPSGRPAPSPVPEEGEESTVFSVMITTFLLPVFNLLIEIMTIPFQRIYAIMNNRSGEEDDPENDEERPPKPGGESRE